MTKHKITFNTINSKYEMDGQVLSLGDTLSLYFDNEWHSAKINYSESVPNGYFAVIIPNNGEPYTKGLDIASIGSRKTYDFDSPEVQSLFSDIK